MIRTVIAAASLALVAATAATPVFAQDYGYRGYSRYGYSNYGYSSYGFVKRDYGSQYSTTHSWQPYYDSYKPSYGYGYKPSYGYGYSRYGYGYNRY